MEIALNPTILVEYKARSSQLVLNTMLALSPLWAGWAPGMAVWIAYSVIIADTSVDNSMLPSLFILMIGLLAISIFTIFVCLQNKFVITKDGIRFPVRFLFELGFALFKPWSEIDSIDFVSGMSGKVLSEYPENMKLNFSGKKELCLNLSSFRREDLKTFFLALQSYVPQLPMNPPLAEVHLGIEAGNSAEKTLSFTQIWENDMAGRFGSTVFVPLEPGEKLQGGQIEIIGQIAFGGLSAVYLAKDKEGRLAVIKESVLPQNADQKSREKALEMFEREAKILMTLKHARIASVLDYFVENGKHYMLLEFIDGKDLRRFVKEKGPQNEATVLRWTAEIADILAYLHNLNPAIVHRDLTPDNIVLEGDGSISLIDFGAANEFLGTATGTLVGKQSYISPEQFRGKASPASDLYSLGASMFFLLTGKDPEALSVSHPKEFAPQVSDKLDLLVAELTSMESATRILSAEELATRCRQILNEKLAGKLLVKGD